LIITAAFAVNDGSQLTEPMGVSTGYINNFHTSRYSYITEWFGRAKSARYRLAKFVGRLVTVAQSLSSSCVFNTNINLKVLLY
jgi:hypothetical protein